MICEVLYSYMENNAELAYLNIVELRQHPMEIRKKIKTSPSPLYTKIESVLQKGREDGSFRTDIDVKHARRLVFGAMNQVITSWLVSGRQYSLTAMAEKTTDFILRGLKP